MGGLLVSFLEMLLYCACIILVAAAIAWAWRTFIGPIDALVYKWGSIVVGLLCIIAFVIWILSALGMAGAGVYHPFPAGRF
jgi:hypothetical protein